MQSSLDMSSASAQSATPGGGTLARRRLELGCHSDQFRRASVHHRFRQVLQVVASSCSLVSGTPRFSMVFGRSWTEVGLKFFSGLHGEHFLQAFQDGENGLAVEFSEPLHKALHVDSPKLIECNEPRSALEPAPRPPRVRAPASCHRCNDDGPQMLVQFVRRYDHAWTRLLDFAPHGGIEWDQIDLTSTDCLAGYRHFHASRSNFVAVDSSRSTSSPRARIRFAATAQPLRGRRAAWTTNLPGWA
jgi:hypothetical protein